MEREKVSEEGSWSKKGRRRGGIEQKSNSGSEQGKKDVTEERKRLQSKGVGTERRRERQSEGVIFTNRLWFSLFLWQAMFD